MATLYPYERFDSGTADREEKTTGETRDAFEKKWTITDATDAADALDALLSGAPVLGGMKRAGSVEPQGGGVYVGTVKYSPASVSAGTIKQKITFDTSGSTAHITHSRVTRSVTLAAGATAPAIAGAINSDGEHVGGVDITVPAFSFTVTRSVPASMMTGSYFATLHTCTGRVNNAAFSVTGSGVTLSFAAGEVLCLGASGGPTSEGHWEIAIKFAASPNETSLPTAGGAITVPSKKGWEYLWVRVGRAADPTTKVMVNKPLAAYVEEVYPTANLGALFT